MQRTSQSNRSSARDTEHHAARDTRGTLTFFHQECPACGRSLRILVIYLGKRVMCRHCHRHFVADDSTAPSLMIKGPTTLERAEGLLRLLEQRETESATQIRENQGSESSSPSV